MRFPLSLAALVALVPTLVAAAPSVSPPRPDVNPFVGKDLYISPVYTASINKEIAALKAEGKKDLAAKAAKVAKVSTFVWFSNRASVGDLDKFLREARSIQWKTGRPQLFTGVVYNLPDRDCSAKASDGELHLDDNGEALYEQYIKSIRSVLLRYPDISTVFIVEPDSIGNVVTNLAMPKCANAAPAYLRLIALTIATLSDLPNVNLYVDAAHSAWLGWPDNVGPTAKLLGQILRDAKARNPKARVRGVSSNVSNYNGLGTQDQQGYDELVYHQTLAPLLEAEGFPAHFITDQGRSGNQEVERSGGDWCNNKAAGFGPRPTTKTPAPSEDAIVWVKPGGESDGTSDTSAVRYDENCGSATSYIPSPESGTWNSGYFRQLIANANPAF